MNLYKKEQTTDVSSPAAKKNQKFFLHHFAGDVDNGVRLPCEHPEHVHLLQAQQLHQMPAANVPPHCRCR